MKPKKGKYEYLPHTADAKIRAYGKTREEQFTNAALAVINIMFDPEKIKPKIEKKISVEGNDEKQLLCNWLQQFLILLDTESFILHSIKKISIKTDKKKAEQKLRLNAVVTGDKYSDKYETLGSVKAVTYNHMEIKDDCVEFVLDL